MKKRFGVVTLGQSPRPDLVDNLNLPQDIEVRVVGALDHATPQDVESLKWKEGDVDLPLFTKYDGEPIVISKNRLVPFLQKAIEQLETTVDLTTIACTESFPEITFSKPTIKIDQMLLNLSKSIVAGSKSRCFGIFMPVKDKISVAEARWGLVGHARAVHLQPFLTKTDILNACLELRQKIAEPDYIVLDCMGYGKNELNILKEEFKKSIIILPVHYLRGNILSFFNS